MLRMIFVTMLAIGCNDSSESGPDSGPESIGGLEDQSGTGDDSGVSGDNGLGENGSGSNGGEGYGALQLPASYDPQALAIKEIEPPVSKNTPPGLIPGSLQGVSLTLTASAWTFECTPDTAYDECDPLSGDEKDACIFLSDITCRYFRTGPTSIKDLLKKVDNQMAEFEAQMDDPEKKYMPCADPNNTGGFGKESTDGTGSDQTAEKPVSFKPYALAETDSKMTFKDRLDNDQNVDLGFSFHISCLDDEFGRGFGRKTINDVEHTFMVDGAVGPENANGSAIVADIDSNDNVKVWFSVGANWDSYADISGTSIVGHLDVVDTTGVMQMTVTGTNTGPGCGMRFISNGTYMFAHVDINDDYVCSAAEATANIKNADSAPTWDSAKTDKTYCIKVDQDQPQLVNLSECTAVDLDLDAFTIDRYERSMVEAYNAPRLLRKKVVGATSPAIVYLKN